MSIFDSDDKIISRVEHHMKVREWCEQYIVGFPYKSDRAMLSMYSPEDDSYIGCTSFPVEEIELNYNDDICPGASGYVILNGYQGDRLPDFIKFANMTFITAINCNPLLKSTADNYHISIKISDNDTIYHIINY